MRFKIIAALLVLSVLAYAGSKAQGWHGTRWEYKLEAFVLFAGHDKEVNKLGQEGWECVGPVGKPPADDSGLVTLLFKRQAP